MYDHKILIIEEDKVLQDILAQKFKNEKFEVYRADSCEGLSFTLTQKPDLILLDIYPVQRNSSLLMKLRKLNSWGRSVPIIILTEEDTNRHLIKNIVDNEPTYFLIKSEHSLDEIVSEVRKKLN